jgi:thiamine biosynthesis lipoprotein
MSAFEPESELSRFNRFASDAQFRFSPDTLRVLEVAQQVSRASGGAFDATVGRVVDAWGFGPGGRRSRPSEERLGEARRAVGWRALELDLAAGTAAKERPAIALDLSGIAKGYGVDLAAGALDALGHSDYLVEVGGEVRTLGRNAEGTPWRLGIERPDPATRTVHRVVPLSGRSLATSGDYRIYFEEGGQRYSHEMDPATGAPVAHALASVSVVADDCVLADAWSTALFVAGSGRGHALAVQHGLAAHFIERGPGGRLAERSTPAFAALEDA